MEQPKPRNALPMPNSPGREKFSRWKGMTSCSREAAEQATPEAVARYRASRLKAGVAVDLCCGIGMDAIALAGNCGKVYAIDIDHDAIECAKKNAAEYGARNIEFICADCTEIDLKKLGVEIAFADPSRRAEGRRVKGLAETRPNTSELIELIKKAGVENFCIEVSAALGLDELPQGCEKEFISLGHEPNCISLYFGDLKKAECSFVNIEDMGGKRHSLQADSVGEAIGTKPQMLRYLFELDEGIVHMKMQKQAHETLGKAREKVFSFNETFFGSTQKAKSGFFRNSFKVLAELESTGAQGGNAGEKEKAWIVHALQRLRAGKAVLRGKFDERGQLEMKREIESMLDGKLKLHVFFFGNKIVIGRNLEIR
ncbi:Release factor glutamine methyltransferase [uncultured archaeon]|nr:Release factor glutamine methyltransferase [uncultured archaeon]